MKQIFRIFTLIAVAMLTAEQAWAGSAADLGSIKRGTVTGGSLRFYKEATCQNEIYPNSNLYSSELTDGKVYIKATPDWNYTAVEVTITAQVSTSSSPAEARSITRGSTAPGVAVGDFINVTATDTKGVYQITMPADEKLNVTVTATFPAKGYQTGVSYIQADGTETTTHDGVKVWVLDGTEGEELGQSDGKTWYICKGSMAYDHRLRTLGDVNIIMSGSLAIGTAESPVNYEGIDANNNLCLYGQASATGTNSVTINSNMQSIRSSSGAITITNCSVDLTSTYNEGIYASGNEKDITITGCAAGTNSVTINSNKHSIYSSSGAVSITNCSVDLSTDNAGINVKNGVTITGCAAGTNSVKVNSNKQSIYSIYGAVSIKNCSVDLISTTNEGINVKNGVTITGCAAGTNSVKIKSNNRAIYSILGAVSITNCSVDLSTDDAGINANNDVTITGCAAGTNSVKVNSKMYSINSSYGAVSITNCSLDLISTNNEGINAKNGVTITGCAAGTNSVKVNSKYYSINSSGAVTITNCSTVDLEVTTTGWNGIQASADLTITGGQVTVTLPESSSSYGLNSNGNIILDWINSTDFVLVPSICCSSAEGSIQFAEGKRFYAYNGTEIEAVYDANMLPTKTNGIYSGLAGRKLTPCTDIFVKMADGVTGVTVSATGGENVTIGTNTWYKVAKGAEVTLSATDSNKQLGSVEITGATATQGDGTFTFTIGESDVTVTAATFLEKVSYIDPMVEGNDKTKTVFATPLTGSETTLAAGWYVVSKDVNYTTVNDNNVLKATGDVNLILADGKTMNIGSEENPVTGRGIYFSSSAALAIYGQGGTTEGSLKVYTGTTNSIQGEVDITIYGGNLTVGSTLSINGKFTIHGGTFTDARTTNDNNTTNITAIKADEINIRGGRVTSVVGSLFGNENVTGDINISGGIVDVRCLLAYNGSIAISGGQVTLTIANNHAINGNNGITLGWTNVTDFISVKGEGHFHSDGDLTISKGKGFLAISGDNSIAYYDSYSTFTKDKYINFSDLTGKTLRPALKISLPAGFTATGTDVVTHKTADTYAIYGATVTINSSNYSAPAGQTLNGFTVKDADNNEVSVTNGAFTMPAKAVTVTANLTNIPATAPTISAQPSNLNLEWGYNSGNVLTVSASAATSHVLSYQWYSNSSNSTTGGSAIQSATSSSYTVPTGLSTGTTYYYCVVTATRSDNDLTATATSNVATVTVEAKDVTYSGGTITQDENGYTVNLTEGTGSANPLPNDADLYKLTYSRTLTAPGSGKGDVTIGGQAAKLYTVCLPFAPKTGTGVKYYTLSSVSGQTVSFEEVTSPAANTPYLVAVTGSTNITESCMSEVVTSTDINTTTKNGYTFTGTFTGLTNSQAVGKHILQSENKWCVVESGSVFIPPFRAYIESASGARELTGSFDDDATGIQNILTVDRDGTERWYDLNGRRIDQPTKKGIYIRNGKKEIRK